MYPLHCFVEFETRLVSIRLCIECVTYCRVDKKSTTEAPYTGVPTKDWRNFLTTLRAANTKKIYDLTTVSNSPTLYSETPTTLVIKPYYSSYIPASLVTNVLILSHINYFINSTTDLVKPR